MSWSFFTHYLFSSRAGALIRTITWICIVGISIGVMSLVVVLSVMNGFNGTIHERLLAVEPHLVVSVPESESGGSGGGAKPIDDLSQLQEEVSQLAGTHASIVENQDVILRTFEGTFGGAMAKGVDRSSLEQVLLNVQRAGKKRKGHYFDFIVDEESASEEQGKSAKTIGQSELVKKLAHLRPGEVILSVDLAHSLRVFEGDQILVIPPESLLASPGETPMYEKVTVKALFSFRVDNVDSKTMYYNPAHTLVQFRRSASRKLSLEIRLPGPYDFSALVAKYEQRGFQVDTWISRNEALFFALKMEKMAITIFLVLSALITCFSIITVLVLLLLQKKRDLGILMAMGLSRTRVCRVFTRVGLFLSFCGIGSGLLLGWGICYLLDRYPVEVLPDIYYDSSIPVQLTSELIYSVLIISTLVAFISSYLPVRANTSHFSAQLLRFGRK